MVTAQYPANIMKINPLKTSSVAAYTELSVIPPSRLQKDCTIVILANNAPKETTAKFQDYHYYFSFQDIVDFSGIRLIAKYIKVYFVRSHCTSDQFYLSHPNN